MLSNEVVRLEKENLALKEALKELSERMERNAEIKPKSCQYCKHFIQHYMKGGRAYMSEYVPIYSGHCILGVPVSKGKKKNPKPDDSCPYFEIGTMDTRSCSNLRGGDMR